MKYCVNIVFFGCVFMLLGLMLIVLHGLDTNSHLSTHLFIISLLLFLSGLAADLFCFIAKRTLTKS